MKKEIALRLKEDEKKYPLIWAIIASRWVSRLKGPSQSTSYFLKPYYFNAKNNKIENNVQFMDGLMECILKFYPNEQILQHEIYKGDSLIYKCY